MVARQLHAGEGVRGLEYASVIEGITAFDAKPATQVKIAGKINAPARARSVLKNVPVP